jgi:hypothetical protein
VALRSVVLAPPPGAGGPRRTVVLRPGGPREKGRLADLLAAVLGALLLGLAVAFTVVLPDREYATPQFRVTFPSTPVDSPTQSFEFTEGGENVHTFSYPLPDNVASVNINAEFRDDITASLPDHFRIELFDPAGNPASQRFDLANQHPVNPDPANLTQPQTQATAELAKKNWVVPLGAQPQEQIVPGITHLETREQVLARLLPQVTLPTAGTWTVRVTLVAANDCPAPSPDSTDFQRMAICRSEAPDGQDPGNRFALTNFIYTTYTPCVEALGTAQAAPLCAPAPAPAPTA